MIQKPYFFHLVMLFLCLVILANCAQVGYQLIPIPDDHFRQSGASLSSRHLQIPVTGQTKSTPTQASASPAVSTIEPIAPAPTSESTYTLAPDNSSSPVGSTISPEPEATSTPQPAKASSVSLPPEQWKSWPVAPAVSQEMRVLYQQGLARGNDPHAFSIIGDCQSQPDVFMGVFDRDVNIVTGLPPELQETVAQFAGSFDRYQPTVKDGSTEGAMLWVDWNDNKEGKCNNGETPIDCELRVHKPSIVLVHVGTHYEVRNLQYLTILVKKIIDSGAVPVMVTKADDRELDERINLNIASVAAELNLPLWNFWSSVQNLDNRGLRVGSNMYLSKESEQVHRLGALEALHTVWQALQP